MQFYFTVPQLEKFDYRVDLPIVATDTPAEEPQITFEMTPSADADGNLPFPQARFTLTTTAFATLCVGLLFCLFFSLSPFLFRHRSSPYLFPLLPLHLYTLRNGEGSSDNGAGPGGCSSSRRLVVTIIKTHFLLVLFFLFHFMVERRLTLSQEKKNIRVN